MSELVTLELPENVARNARDLAKRTDRRVEDILVDWLDKAAAEIPVESLPNEEILALCEKQLDDEQQAELSLLLEQNREGALNQEEQEGNQPNFSIHGRWSGPSISVGVEMVYESSVSRLAVAQLLKHCI